MCIVVSTPEKYNYGGGEHSLFATLLKPWEKFGNLGTFLPVVLAMHKLAWTSDVVVVRHCKLALTSDVVVVRRCCRLYSLDILLAW